jgi:hypothetical protein
MRSSEMSAITLMLRLKRTHLERRKNDEIDPERTPPMPGGLPTSIIWELVLRRKAVERLEQYAAASSGE